MIIVIVLYVLGLVGKILMGNGIRGLDLEVVKC